ncbi:sulfur globule family protein [Actinomyces bowdenii]|uniref:DUF7847 domain-containing protein n=1 Tax=Actinomyces bowdenii TaxID=131109 RepID=A0A3P1URB5_9ACTO|nr:sulfur globule family protein [Actinomyces bowdenii]RRD24434.1 hypothetical protein EII10_11260 [Actinomyces bowdenii]
MSSTHLPGWEPPSSNPPSPQPPQSPGGQQDGSPRYGDYGTAPVGQPGYPQGGYQGYSAPSGPPYGSGPYGGAPYGAGMLGAPRPGIIPLRPLAFGEILGGAFESLRANPRAMFVPALVVMSITGAISAIIFWFLGSRDYASLFDPSFNAASEEETAAVAEDFMLGLLTQYGVIGVLSTLATAILTGLLIVTVSRTILGRLATPGEVWERTKGRLWALIGQAVLTTLITSGVLVVITALAMIPAVLVITDDSTGPAGAGAALILGFLGIVVAALVSMTLYFKLCLAPAALILEHVGIMEGIRRSWALTRGHFWRTAGIRIVSLLIISFASYFISAPVGALAGFLTAIALSSDPILAAQVSGTLSTFLGMLVAALIQPFDAAVIALQYTDVRMRSEGLDIELRRAAGV